MHQSTTLLDQDLFYRLYNCVLEFLARAWLTAYGPFGPTAWDGRMAIWQTQLYFWFCPPFVFAFFLFAFWIWNVGCDGRKPFVLCVKSQRFGWVEWLEVSAFFFLLLCLLRFWDEFTFWVMGMVENIICIHSTSCSLPVWWNASHRPAALPFFIFFFFWVKLIIKFSSAQTCHHSVSNGGQPVWRLRNERCSPSASMRSSWVGDNNRCWGKRLWYACARRL